MSLYHFVNRKNEPVRSVTILHEFDYGYNHFIVHFENGFKVLGKAVSLLLYEEK